MSDNGDDFSDVLAGLSEREKKVLKERFGLEELTSSSLKEIGKKIDITREKIRSIEERALKKLNKNGAPDNDGPEAA